jgi:fructose-1,6-bisphosphatase I
MAQAKENGGGPVGGEKINTDIVTLTRHLTEEQTKHKEATGDFTYAQQVFGRWSL